MREEVVARSFFTDQQRDGEESSCPRLERRFHYRNRSPLQSRGGSDRLCKEAIAVSLPASRSFGSRDGYIFRNEIKKGPDAGRQMLAVGTDGEEVGFVAPELAQALDDRARGQFGLNGWRVIPPCSSEKQLTNTIRSGAAISR